VSELPDKQYFKIGEVARITGVKPHVLRYWETEFSSIRPQKTRTNQRLYRRRDVELLLQIKQLLYQEGFTIAGANKRLRELARQQGPRTAVEPEAVVAQARATDGVAAQVRAEIQALLAFCEHDEDA
jgi:DNA-binding transcriptional MerR regulator